MSKNPVINACCAFGYIVIVGGLMNLVSKMLKNKPDTIFDPIALITLFTLSAALMGYFFLYQPVQLYLDGKKKEGAKLFVRTILVFSGITILVFILLLYLVI